MAMRRPKKASRKVLAIGAGILAEALALRLRGYPMGTNVIVRCRRGHLFSTIWLPGISFKSLRLIWWRGQRCPVGNHWTIVTPVRRGEISDAEVQSARERKDVRVP
jgi:hypothetical protein